jgi:hypothetical protein
VPRLNSNLTLSHSYNRSGSIAFALKSSVSVLRVRFRRMSAILRFWGHDIWTDSWDHQRRVLLCKHYWSYVKYRAVPPSYLPDMELRTVSGEEQVRFCEAFRKRIDQVQSHARTIRSIHLTYRPIGKNIRLVGTALRDNVDAGRATQIASVGPKTEERALASMGRRWDPWLWSRDQSNDRELTVSADEGWNSFFKYPRKRTNRNTPMLTGLPRLQVNDGPFPTKDLKKVLKVAVATNYVFTPTDSFLDHVNRLRLKMDWPGVGEKVLGIHVRRGDAATNNQSVGEVMKSTRKSFPIDNYLEAADRICAKYGIKHIFLATESNDEIERAKRLRPQYSFLCIQHDRSIFPDITTSDQFIEDLALDQPERARALATSAIFDLHFLAECHGFVGAFNSEFSLLGWLLLIGRRKQIVPYISLSHPTKRLNFHPFESLLNLRNNCPLELYHW